MVEEDSDNPLPVIDRSGILPLLQDQMHLQDQMQVILQDSRILCSGRTPCQGRTYCPGKTSCPGRDLLFEQKFLLKQIIFMTLELNVISNFFLHIKSDFSVLGSVIFAKEIAETLFWCSLGGIF